MKTKHIILVVLLTITTGLFAQFGIKTGVNMANEIKSFSQADIAAGFDSKNLNGYQIGLIYQAMPKKSGLGFEIAAILTQKGSAFTDTSTVAGIIQKGYRELNYVEVPLNLRYRLMLGFISIYGTAGVYGSYELSGKTVNEITDATQNSTYPTFMDHVDYGYNLGLGLELFKKMQFGGTWSQGIKNSPALTTGLPSALTSSNRVFSINLVYMF
ncbi:MAG: outer membrane beta-barrel protein [Paludibacter sp.]